MSPRRFSLPASQNPHRVSTILPSIDLINHDEIQQTAKSQGIDSTNDSTNASESASELVSQQKPDKAIKAAAYALLFQVFADGINFSCVRPNYPAMTMVGMYPQSFPSIEPWMGMASAQYFLLGCSSVASVLSGFIFGSFTKRIGYRKVFLILAGGSVVCTIVKYLCRGTYWGYTVAAFVNSLFGGSVTVANSYVGLIFREREVIDGYIGYVLGVFLLSYSLGGLLTVVTPSDLFLPLLPAAGISFVSLVVTYFFLVEPSISDDVDLEETENEDVKATETAGSPEKLDRFAFLNIVIGAFIDNIGSLALVPLAFSPVMYEKYFLHFQMQNLPPVMSENEYRWLYSMIALTVVPSVAIAPTLYKRLGIALTCVLANIMTGVITVLLLFAAERPPTHQSYAIFTTIVYIGTPLAVISNLTTSPMLDRISPIEMKAMAQGVNSAVYNVANALFPIVLGIVSDMRGYMRMLYILVGVQVLASVVNLPLLCHPLLRRGEKRKADEDVLNENEDELGIKEDEVDEDIVDDTMEMTRSTVAVTRRTESALSC